GSVSIIGTGGAIRTYTRAPDEVGISMRRPATEAASKGAVNLTCQTLQELIRTLLKQTLAADSKGGVKQRTNHQPAPAHLDRFCILIDPRRNFGAAKCL
ncbi:MAG TPA: hypothetical protein VK775_23480, partial [Chthoniobacterales bacterium]|nr:hypothetical protein [Chthoniobacterales bacterium]